MAFSDLTTRDFFVGREPKFQIEQVRDHHSKVHRGFGRFIGRQGNFR